MAALPNQTTVFEHQIAGHRHEHGSLYTGMLKHDDGFVMKPVQNNMRGKREIEFYKEVFQSSHPVISKLQEIVPKFFGVEEFVLDLSVYYYIKMEDIASGMLKPCLADIKIGRQTWDPYSSTEKQIAENMKYRGTKEQLGFCVPGMCVYDLKSETTIRLDKHYGRSLNHNTVKEALLLYLNSSQAIERQLVGEILSQLKKIKVWFEEQRHYLFYATSLLLAYDADKLRGDKSFLDVRVRMIDFAHVYPAQGTLDTNYLEGLSKLISIMESLYERDIIPTDDGDIYS